MKSLKPPPVSSAQSALKPFPGREVRGRVQGQFPKSSSKFKLTPTSGFLDNVTRFHLYAATPSCKFVQFVSLRFRTKPDKNLPPLCICFARSATSIRTLLICPGSHSRRLASIRGHTHSPPARSRTHSLPVCQTYSDFFRPIFYSGRE